MVENNTVGLVVIGDEILKGQIVDTNTSYLAQRLRVYGLKLSRVTVIPDNVDEISNVVSEASKSFATVFTCGGVGPTHDDVTYEAISKSLGLQLEKNEKLLKFYEKLIAKQPEFQRLSNTPSPCEVIFVNGEETFHVIKVSNVYVLPGSPKYFQPAVDAILPTLKGNVSLYNDYIDISADELSIVNILDQQAKKWEGKVCLGSYPQSGRYPCTKITFEGKEEDVKRAKEELKSCLPSQDMVLSETFSLKQAQQVIEHSKDAPFLKQALDILEQCYTRYKPSEVFLCFNGGKDCTTILHLASAFLKVKNLPPILCLYVTGDDFLEVDLFVVKAEKYYNLKLVRVERPMKRALEKFLSDNKHLKACLIGTRRRDPGSENLKPFAMTDQAWPEVMRVSPILDWTYDQVWKFLLDHKVPYCSLYDQGYTSLGNKSNTVPNSLLRDPANSSAHLPAYQLRNPEAERQNRH